MRTIFLAVPFAAAVALAGTFGATAAPANGMAIGNAAAATTLVDQVQRCRCVERRWNGSCKLRVCRDRWSAEVDSASSADEPADDDRSLKSPDQAGKRKASKGKGIHKRNEPSKR